MCYGAVVRRLMLLMHDLGLLNGEYMAITLENLPGSCIENDGRDEDACNAYQGLLDISLYVPDSQEYEDFKISVYNRMPEMNYTMDSPNDVSSILSFPASRSCFSFMEDSRSQKVSAFIACGWTEVNIFPNRTSLKRPLAQ